MTIDDIRQASLKRFAEQGFDGTSMTQIAEDVGIKAPAIYAHFKGKKELYLELLETCVGSELEYTRVYLGQAGEAELVLSSFLEDIGERFETSSQLRFIMAASYLPPRDLADRIGPVTRHFMDGQESVMNDVFRLLPPSRLPPEELASAYMGIVDSIQAEYLYGGKERFQKRLHALWAVFRLALA